MYKAESKQSLFFLLQNYLRRVLSLEYWSHKTQRLWASTKQNVLIKHLVPSKWIDKFVRQKDQSFSLLPDPVALNQGQDHSYWHQNVEYSSIYYRNKFQDTKIVFFFLTLLIQAVFASLD